MIEVRVEHPRGAAAGRLLSRKARAFLSALGRSRRDLSILLTGDAGIRRLNARWRRKNAATDVLSFPATEPAGGGPHLGDVVVSLDTAARRAREEGRPVGDELARYLAHGILHLLGHDHANPAEARRMAREEARLVGAAGMVGEAHGMLDTRRVKTDKERPWISSRTSTSTRKRSGSTGRGTRARTSPARSSR